MEGYIKENTIAAIATPIGEGGIGIIRISGQESLDIIGKIFNNHKRLTPNKLVYGNIIDNYRDKNIDEAMVVYFKEPFSYTREDVVEIQCHGSIISLKNILDLVIKNGAKLAEPGEFTKRAFLNGRLDLSQAEAVMDLISAKSDIAFDVALEQLSGSLSFKISEIREKLTDILVNMTVNIDYPDEDIEVITYKQLIDDLTAVDLEITKLIDSADTGKIVSEGLRVSIIGKANVGKSSLMNLLLKEGRAIVTAIPGTTRDVIEEELNFAGIRIRLVDTAGIRQTEDIVEKIGIEKSKEAVNNSDLVLFMVDNDKALSEEDLEIMDKIKNKKVIVLVNKTDLNRKVETDIIKEKLPESKLIEISVKKETGIDALEEAIKDMVFKGQVTINKSQTVTNLRHKKLLESSRESVLDAISNAKKNFALELLEIDVKNAYDETGKILGETVEDDIIEKVFERFCLGK